jgi:hypothetical protein
MLENFRGLRKFFQTDAAVWDVLAPRRKDAKFRFGFSSETIFLGVLAPLRENVFFVPFVRSLKIKYGGGPTRNPHPSLCRKRARVRKEKPIPSPIPMGES